jgi:hypothetical protein
VQTQTLSTLPENIKILGLAIDECHVLRNEAKGFDLCKKLSEASEVVIAATATPVCNRMKVRCTLWAWQSADKSM